MSSFCTVGGGGLLLLLCLVCSSMAQSQLQETEPLDNQEMLRQVQALLRSVQTLLDPSNQTDQTSPDVNAACRCGGLQCTCCQRIRIPKLKLNDNCCVTIRYLKANIGFLTTLTFRGKVLFSKEISVRNPIPICIGVPYLTRGASICIQLNDLRAGKGWAHGCATLLGRLVFVTVAKIRLGCFNLRFLEETGSSEGLPVMELPFNDIPNWIQPDAPFPVFEDEVMMMENIERPLVN